jgi:hypothetical protein
MFSSSVVESVSESVSESLDERHIGAIEKIRQYLTLLERLPSLSEYLASGISDEITTCLQGFKSHGLVIPEIIRFLQVLLRIWNEFVILGKKNSPKVQESKKKLSARWNKCLNKFRGRLTETSCFNELMFINGHHGFYEPTQEEPRKRTDVQTLEKNEDGYVRLHLSEGRIFSETNEDMVQRLLIHLRDVRDPNELTNETAKTNALSWVKVGMRIKPTKFGIWIYFRWSDPTNGFATEKRSRIHSNNPAFLQHFLGGSYPGHDKVRQLLRSPRPDDIVKYGAFFQLAKLMKLKIYELIEYSSRNPDEFFSGHYTVIKCPRTQPSLCGCNTVIMKPQSKTIPFCCTSCNMDLCQWGCGRIHHGGDCHEPPDAASAELIEQTTMFCPGCRLQFHKSEGCNHITCGCKVEFCYLCGEEYEKDHFGHYQVTEHHADLQYDGRARCSLFG